MEAKIVTFAQFQQLGQWIHRSDCRCSDRSNNSPNATLIQSLLQAGNIESSEPVGWDGFKFHPQYSADAAVGVMRLTRSNDCRTGAKLSGNPQCFEIAHGSSAAKMAQVRLPPKHPCNFRDGLFLHF